MFCHGLPTLQTQNLTILIENTKLYIFSLGVCIYIAYQIKKCVYIIKKTCIYMCVHVCGIVLINILVPQFGPLNKNSWLCPCIHGHSNSSDGALPIQDKTNKQSRYYF